MANFGEILSNIAIGAGQSIRRNALDSAFEAYTPGGSALGNNLTPTLDQTITDNYGLFVPEYYEIASGTFLECGTGSILEIG